MDLHVLEDIVIGLAVLVFVVYRQVRVRRLTGMRGRLLVVLTALGAYQTYAFVHDGGDLDAGSVVAVLIAFALAAVLAWPRARSLRVWQREDGTWMARGSVVTVAWWLVTMAAHLLSSWAVPQLFGQPGELMGGLEQATLMFYLVITLGVQGWVNERRRVTPEVSVAA